MKQVRLYILGVVVFFAMLLSNCAGYSSGGGYRGVNHYHHGVGVWGGGYYGGDVIIVDDGIDIGMPDVIDYPVEHY